MGTKHFKILAFAKITLMIWVKWICIPPDFYVPHDWYTDCPDEFVCLGRFLFFFVRSHCRAFTLPYLFSLTAFAIRICSLFTNIRMAFAFSCILLPHLQQCALRFHLPGLSQSKIRGFHVPRYCRFVNDLGLSSTPTALHLSMGS